MFILRPALHFFKDGLEKEEGLQCGGEIKNWVVTRMEKWGNSAFGGLKGNGCP